MASNAIIRRCYLLKQNNFKMLLRCASTTTVNNCSRSTLNQQTKLFTTKNEKPTHLNQILNRTISVSSVNFANLVTIESPAYAESIKEGDITFVKKVGESVKVDEVVAKIETDKTTIDVTSPNSGVVTQLLVNDGDSIKANTKIIIVDTEGAASAPVSTPTAATAPQAPTPAAEAQRTAPPPPPPSPQQQQAPSTPQPFTTIPIADIPVTPFRYAVDTSLQSSSGVKQDINRISGTRQETRVKMSKMRQTVAGRLKNAQNTCAMLTTFNEVNMGNLVELRKTYGDAFFKKHNIKLGYMSAFVKAAANALVDQPAVNAVIDGNEIVYRDYVDISVAVATPKGLVVPVVRNVERMNYADIEKEINELGERARNNKLAIEDMQGGTFTISNGGVFGSLFGTPIINLPQSAILGMHAIFDRPVAVNGQVVIKPMMYIALTYDHRLIDGREAVTFLKKIKSAIEDPRTLLLDI